MPQVKIYTTDYCGFCNAAKRLLEANQIPFEQIHLQARSELDALIAKTGHSTLPQIFIDDELIGGFQELRELDQNGELKKKLGV